MLRNAASIVVLSIACCSANEVAAGDLDRYNAAATMHTWACAAERIASRCAKEYPELGAQIQSDLSKWKRNDKIAILRGEETWREMQAASPRSTTEEREDEMQLNRLWAAISNQGPSDPAGAGKLRCAAYFANRASGALRASRPDVFRALEQ